MADPRERALVVKALQKGLGGGVEWDRRAAERVISDNAFSPKDVRRRLIEHVRRHGENSVKQRGEGRERWRDEFDYVYEVIVPYEGLKHGLYVEMRLVDDDPDEPVVVIVNAHRQLK